MALDYTRDVRIDIAHFDQEWLRQADLALTYGEELAQARMKMDKTDESVKVEKAKALLRAFEEIKSPVDKVKASADVDPAYLDAVSAYNQASHEYGLVRAAYDAIMVKKSAMENYLKGQVAGLWGTPIEPPRREEEEQPRYSKQAEERTKEQANKNAQEAATRRRRTV